MKKKEANYQQANSDQEAATRASLKMISSCLRQSIKYHRSLKLRKIKNSSLKTNFDRPGDPNQLSLRISYLMPLE